MTTEEKAKAYDEALERAKTLYENANGMILKKWVEQVFPELAESEDEKVRKEILSFCQNRADNYPNDPKYANIGSWISWLERQGEHANFRNKIQVGDKVTRNEAGVLVNLSQLKRVAKTREKQGGQKASYTTIVETGDGGINALVTRELPIEMKSAEESLGVDSGTYNKIIDECIFGEQKPTDKVEGRIQPQPKQEWSKEDEMILSIIVDNLNFIRDTISHDAKYMVDVGSVEGQIEWLKSIQDMVQPQPKQEWSEEDEDYINDLITYFSQNERLKNTKEDIVIWLKSLRPQNYWKPSEGDIIILEKLINGELEPKVFQATLQGILEQLKKLKEE